MDYVTATSVGYFAHEWNALDPIGQALQVTAASRLFDSECEVSEGFFAEESGLSEERIFLGDGTAYLRIPPYVDLTSVTINEGTADSPNYSVSNVPEYVEQDGMLIVLDKTVARSSLSASYPNRFTGWPDGKQIKVDAVWGLAFVPHDIQLAVIHLALHLWRTADPAFATISNGDGAASRERTLPEVARRVIDAYREKYTRRALF